MNARAGCVILFSWEMLVVLPDKQDGLPNLLSHLEKRGGIDKILKVQFAAEDVILNLPRFKLGEGPAVDVKKILNSLGMRLVFDERSADLSGICKSERLVVSEVLHKAILEVRSVLSRLVTFVRICECRIDLRRTRGRYF